MAESDELKRDQLLDHIEHREKMRNRLKFIESKLLETEAERNLFSFLKERKNRENEDLNNSNSED